MKNYYEILGLSPDASKEEIEKVTIKKLRLWNHRANAPSLERRQEAERMIALLEEIRDTLTNPKKREQYDQTIIKSQQISGKLVQNQAINLPSTASNQHAFQNEESRSERPDPLPLVAEASEPKEEKPPFTTGPVPVKQQPESKSEKESETTPQAKSEQEEPEKVEKENAFQGKVRIRKSWIWGIGLLVVISIGLILYTQFIHSLSSASPLEVGQEVNIKHGFIFKVESLTKEANSTRLQISVKPTGDKFEKYQNAFKQIKNVKEMVDRGEVRNVDQIQQVVDKPLIEMTIRFEDSNGNLLGTLKTSDAQRLTNQINSEEVAETFLWSMSVFPKSTRYLVIETIQGIESDHQQSMNNKMLLDADRIKYTINQRFILQNIEANLAEM